MMLKKNTLLTSDFLLCNLSNVNAQNMITEKSQVSDSNYRKSVWQKELNGKEAWQDDAPVPEIEQCIPVLTEYPGDHIESYEQLFEIFKNVLMPNALIFDIVLMKKGKQT